MPNLEKNFSNLPILAPLRLSNIWRCHWSFSISVNSLSKRLGRQQRHSGVGVQSWFHNSYLGLSILENLQVLWRSCQESKGWSSTVDLGLFVGFSITPDLGSGGQWIWAACGISLLRSRGPLCLSPGKWIRNWLWFHLIWQGKMLSFSDLDWEMRLDRFKHPIKDEMFFRLLHS